MRSFSRSGSGQISSVLAAAASTFVHVWSSCHVGSIQNFAVAIEGDAEEASAWDPAEASSRHAQDEERREKGEGLTTKGVEEVLFELVLASAVFPRPHRRDELHARRCSTNFHMS